MWTLRDERTRRAAELRVSCSINLSLETNDPRTQLAYGSKSADPPSLLALDQPVGSLVTVTVNAVTAPHAAKNVARDPRTVGAVTPRLARDCPGVPEPAT
jgi:hypothetical protein